MATQSAGGREDEATVEAFVTASSERALRSRLVVLLTLAAGATDALSFLDLDRAARVFTSFMTGNILFVGLAVVQHNGALLLRAMLAILIFLAGVTMGSLYLGRVPHRRTRLGGRGALARFLLIEGLFLLGFGILWLVMGDPARHPVPQLALLGMAAFAMGLQGALVAEFSLPNVVSIALTGTELLLGIRLAQRIGKQAPSAPGAPSVPFLVMLMLAYTLAAIVVALTREWLGRPFIPFILVTVAFLVVLVTPAAAGDGKAVGKPVRGTELEMRAGG